MRRILAAAAALIVLFAACLPPGADAAAGAATKAIAADESAAGGPAGMLMQGNALYQEGKYAEALEAYKQVEASGYENGPLYYNMGNCHYKLQNIGYAVLYYERALKLLPGDEEVRFNLDLANLQVVDKITPLPEFILFRITRFATHLLPLKALSWATAGLYIAFMALLSLWVLSRRRGARIVSFRLGVFFGIVFAVFLFTLAGRMVQDRKDVEAVVLADKVDAMSAPGGEGIEVFSLHEGTKVRIDNTSGEWVEIALADGKVGWVQREALETI